MSSPESSHSPPPKNLHHPPPCIDSRASSSTPIQIQSQCAALLSPRRHPSPQGAPMLLESPQMLLGIIATHLSPANFLIIERTTLSPSPQPERGNRRQSRPATTLPFLPLPLTHNPWVHQVSHFRLDPRMDRLRHLRSLIINLATNQRIMRFRTSSR